MCVQIHACIYVETMLDDEIVVSQQLSITDRTNGRADGTSCRPSVCHHRRL